MPLYEYRCHQCGQVFEKMQKFSDEPLTQHPECGGAVERLLSAPALQFKGSGWYITDYARSGGGSKGGEKSESKSESKSKTETEFKTETKSESKPASTASGSTSSS
ncbi:MAG: FmdB family zinc ribbon protein [Bryobacteraceae bacterium]